MCLCVLSEDVLDVPVIIVDVVAVAVVVLSDDVSYDVEVEDQVDAELFV